MKNIKAFLFDMDGVVADTEKQYDDFLGKIQKNYELPENFIQNIKGTTLTDIMIKYFSHLSEEKKKEVADKVLNFELNEMEYNPIPGVIDFIQLVKKEGYKAALVTSSVKAKVKAALKEMNLQTVFDAVVTADDITEGKPNPQCYLLAAKQLGFNPEECIVLEDAFAGIEAGQKAGMKVIGVSTTNSAESLQEKVEIVIPDFKNVQIENLIK